MAKILIVDDDELLCEMLQAMLQMHGYSVRIAPHGEAGLAALQAEPADLVILDLVMPRMDGLRFLRLLPTLIAVPPPILMASASATPQMQLMLGEGKVAGILRKPVRAGALLEAIAALLPDGAPAGAAA